MTLVIGKVDTYLTNYCVLYHETRAQSFFFSTNGRAQRIKRVNFFLPFTPSFSLQPEVDYDPRS